ncbi:MAG: 2-C-methyl-D-erythritol 4-phosphate cytidylyltransferase [Clostridiales bacterium]
MEKTSVIIVAAGKGKRMNSNINKQFIDILNKPLIVRTIERFYNLNFIEEIIVVINKNEIEYFKENILNKYNLKKIKKIVSGGKERQESVYNGILSVSDNSKIVMIHDGARPFIEEKIIQKAINETEKYGATIVAIPVKDTIKSINTEKYVETTLKRSKLYAIQTPQTFYKDIITKAHKEALKSNFLGTDDSMLVENIGIKVKIVEGEIFNIKVTTKEDLIISEAIINSSLKNKNL